MQRKPKATAARFDETEPVTTNSKTTSTSTTTATTPAQKTGGRYKVNSNGKEPARGRRCNGDGEEGPFTRCRGFRMTMPIS
jgi:hypothetical protein